MFISRFNLKSTFPLFVSIRSLSNSPFSFLPTNKLPTKPNRKKGITEIRGPYYAPVSRTYLDELLSDWGEYVDGINQIVQLACLRKGIWGTDKTFGGIVTFRD